MIVIEQHAMWLPQPWLFCKQIIVSLWSYITLPLFRKKENGIQNFFERNYYKKCDGLIFDGNTNGYLDKAKDLIARSYRDVVFDLGCGDSGNLYLWLTKNAIEFRFYIGIDFSIRGKTIDQKARLINGDIRKCNVCRKPDRTAMIVLSNSLCYLSDSEFSEVLKIFESGDEILVIEPEPNLFWDAHFAGIKPIYRKHEEVIKKLEACGFEIKALSVDYLLKRHIRIAYSLYGIMMQGRNEVLLQK